MNWKTIYEFPLARRGYMVFTKEYEKAFDFAFPMLYKNCYKFEDDQMDEIVRKINGEEISFAYTDLHYDSDNTTIYVTQDGVKREFIVVRGWGHLTGTGGLNLPPEQAATIQNAFGEYIVKTLSTP